MSSEYAFGTIFALIMMHICEDYEKKLLAEWTTQYKHKIMQKYT